MIQTKENTYTQEDNGQGPQKPSVLSNRIQEPLKLKILILSGTEIMVKELENIKSCTNLLKLDISSNKIQNFPKSVSFKNLRSLKLLYLHNNLIDDAESLYKIFEIPNLMYLTLFNNPLSTKWSLRHFVVNSMPQLFALDFNAISDEERMEQVARTDRFYALSPSTKINWPLISIPQETILHDDEYLLLLREELKIIIRKYTENSPTVIIQRVFRGHQCRKQLKNRLKTAEDRLQLSLKVSSHWKKHTVRKLTLKQLLQERGKEYLLYEKKSYHFHRGLDKLKKLFREFLYRFRIKKQMQMAARIILKAFRRMKSFLNSYQSVLFPQVAQPLPSIKSKQTTPGSKSSPKQQRIQFNQKVQTATPKGNQSLITLQPTQISIYFHRDQVREFSKIFNDCTRYLPSNEVAQNLYKEVKNNLFSKYVKKADKILGIRVIESQESKNHIYYSKYPFNALMRPSLKSKVLITKSEQKYYDMQYHPFFSRFNRHINLPNMDRKLQKPQMSKKDWEKFQYLYNKIQRFQNKEYECLMEFICPDASIATAFTKEIISYNHKAFYGNDQDSSKQESSLYQDTEELLKGKYQGENQEESNFLTSVANQQEEDTQGSKKSTQSGKKKPLFLVFFKNYLMQVSSAIKIQKMWRYHKSKPIQVKVFAIIQQKRACSKIQHWVRNIRWYHKRSFLSQLSYYIHQQVTTNTLFLHFTTYQSLPNIHDKTIKKQTLTFQEQENIIQYSPSKGTVRLTWNFDNLYHQFLMDLQKRIFPKWLRLTADQGARDMADDEYCGDIMHLIHVSSKIGIVTIGGMKFIKMEFPSLQEAKYRAAALALNTYRFRNNGYFIKFFTYSQISNYSFILSEETDLKATYSNLLIIVSNRLSQLFFFIMNQLDLDLQYDQSRCLIKDEQAINNENSLFLSSNKKVEFNQKAGKICKMYQVDSITMYKETQNPLITKNLLITRNTALALSIPSNQKPPIKLEENLHLHFNDSIYVFKQPNNQVVVSGKNLNEQIRVSIETPNFDMPSKKVVPQLATENFEFPKKGLPQLTNDTSTKYAKSEFDSTVISFYKGNQANMASTPYSRYRSKPLLDNSTHNIVTDVSLLKDQNRQNSRDFQALIKDREEQSTIAKHKGIMDSKKRSYLIKEIKNMDKLIQLNEQKQIHNVEKKNREFKKEVDMRIDIEQKLQRVEVLKQIGMQTKSEEMWAQNFNRSQNYLVKQMTQINKKKAQEDLLKRNMQKANKVRERKLLGTSQQSRPSNSSHQRNRTESSFYSSATGSNQNNFMLTSLNEGDAQLRNQIGSRGGDRATSLQPSQNMLQIAPSVQLGIFSTAHNTSIKKKSKRLNTSSDVMYRTTTNGSNPMDTITGLNTEPNELTNIISLESTFYGMNQLYNKNHKVQTEGDEKVKANNKSFLQDRRKIKSNKPQTPFSNKIVHAVFPEEFYPISTGSNQFKLQL